MILNWIKIFVYQLKQNLLFSILNVLGLSIGIAGIIFAILYWNEEQSYNDWNPYKDRVFQSINRVSPTDYWASNVAPLEAHLKTDFSEIESYCYMDNWYYEEIIQYKNKKEIIKITNTQKTFFEMFPFHFIKGDIKTALKDNASIAISKEASIKIFGSEDPIGKIVTYSGKKLMVRGVYTFPGKSSIQPEAVVNLMDDRLEDGGSWGNFSYGLMIKLKNPNDKDKVVARIQHLMFENRVVKWAKSEGITVDQWLKKNGGDDLKVILEPIKISRLHSISDGFAEGKGNYQMLLIMVGLSVLILILSIVNYINLATANAIKRAKEVGVRKIIGASKSNIIKQFLFETTLITAFAILLALAIVELSLPYYNDFLNKKLVIHGEQFYLQLVGIFLFTIAVAGVFPAVYVSNFETLKVLKGNFGRSKSGIWLRNGMLIVQFAIATFFIIGSYIVYEQIQYISTKDLGFKGDQVLSINYRNKYNWKEKNYKQKISNRYNMVKAEISKISGVQQVATGAFSFGTGDGSTTGFAYKDGHNIQGRNMAVDFGMLEMMQIKIKEGRTLSEKFASDTISSILVNETALREMNEKDPIGKEVKWNDKKLKIIGVVKDFNLFGPQEKVPPMVFFHFKTIDWMLQNANKIHVKIKSGNMEQTIADIEKFWKKNVDGDYPFQYDFVDKQYARTYENYVKQKNLFSLLNVVVILIALFGLFALASYSIERRMKEIAIRKTLGAETGSLLKELSRQYLIFCIIGFIVAFVPTWLVLNKWLENFAYRITISAVPFLIGFVVLCTLTIFIVVTKAYQATRINVLKYLKYE
ncbi:ABC transporter permease [Flavobacterium noncentrifugens]|uniref:Putative ABC transport system permease protein n=1 Tax=Flavobacterium noncentrifugens TaxID=1128970 RepID=A0A1G9ARH5_9FLAO|nr:ABC transporter permease [Flavobacterium noncentrifugens]GEP51534.1 ABC transporter permease [Flavobacterium noncentrifugens]SDK29210.1 putative ABC transport system permease protein [Flavobacterium noncentrifugens]